MKKYLFFSLVLVLLAMAFIPAEKYLLQGRITDEQGTPLPGATILSKLVEKASEVKEGLGVKR